MAFIFVHVAQLPVLFLCCIISFHLMSFIILHSHVQAIVFQLPAFFVCQELFLNHDFRYSHATQRSLVFVNGSGGIGLSGRKRRLTEYSVLMKVV
jgi:hypothetical protein